MGIVRRQLKCLLRFVELNIQELPEWDVFLNVAGILPQAAFHISHKTQPGSGRHHVFSNYFSIAMSPKKLNGLLNEAA